MALFNRDNPKERLSTSYSRTRTWPKPTGPYVVRDKLTEGDALLSSICRPMMIIVKETAEPKGVHDTHHRMCNRYLYESHGVGPRDGCHENISKAVAPYGIVPEEIPDTFDINMNYPHNCREGRWEIKEPVSRPGDFIEFKAMMDLIVGLSNCPEDVLTLCNGKHCTPVKVEVYE